MKTKTTKAEIATQQPKGKVKLQNLKLHKETLQNLSDSDAGAVRGGRAGTDPLATLAECSRISCDKLCI
jgi:hypothetical protein